MTPIEFIDKFYPFAVQIEKETGIPAIAIIAQSALESGWGEKAIGNNVFGIKFRKGDYGYREVLTTEYSSDRNKFIGKNIKSVTFDHERNLYKFKVYQYFADYKNPYEAFLAHSKLLLNERYKSALRWSYSPKRYLIAIWRLGYATDPNYGVKICKMVDSVKKRL